MSRRIFPDEFKADAVRLVVKQQYSLAQASEAMAVGDTGFAALGGSIPQAKGGAPRTVDWLSAVRPPQLALELSSRELLRQRLDGRRNPGGT